MGAFKDTAGAIKAIAIFIGLFIIVAIIFLLWSILGIITPTIIVTFFLFILLWDSEDSSNI